MLMIDRVKSGMRIKECRKQQHMTVEYLAERIDISPEFLYAIESGQKGMSIYTLSNIAIALHTSTDYLLFGKESQKD